MPLTTLIDSPSLNAQLGNPDWLIIDVRHDLAAPQSGRLAWQQSHIPGAVFLHMDEDLSGTKTGSNGRHPLPDKTHFIEKLRALGVNETTQIIAYDAQGCMMAARLWWMLRWIGHEAVAVLDGGLPAWQTQNLPLEATAPLQRQIGNVQVKPEINTTVTAAAVLANIASAASLVIDARAPDRFRGENETLDPVGGHIPGAKNRFFRDNLAESGYFKSPTILAAEYNALMAGKTAPEVIMQCGSGVTACHNLLATNIAGLTGALLYSGSWSEWCSDPSRPIATGI